MLVLELKDGDVFSVIYSAVNTQYLYFECACKGQKYYKSSAKAQEIP